jgi:hypothetical protein
MNAGGGLVNTPGRAALSRLPARVPASNEEIAMLLRPLLLSAALGLVAVGGALHSPGAQAAVHVGIGVNLGPPPAPRYERVAVRRGFVWAPGYWQARGHRYVWVPGHYERVRRGYVYRPAAWYRHGAAWRFRTGVWVRR